MSRNSLIPVIAMLLVAAIALLAIRGHRPIGADGPQLAPGILRLPKRADRLVVSAPLQADNVIDEDVPFSAPPALEPDPWRLVLIAADDRKPTTAAVVLALAERLTAAGSVAVIDTTTAQPLPTPANRVLRVDTLESTIPVDPSGACHARVRIREECVQLPAGHPAADLQALHGATDRVIIIDHHSRAESGAPTWPERWAGVGRSLADSALQRLGAVSPLPTDWDRRRPQLNPNRLVPWQFTRPGAFWGLLIVPVFIGLRIVAMRRLPAQHRGRRGWSLVRPWLMGLTLTAVVIYATAPRRYPPLSSNSEPVPTWTSRLPLPPNLEVVRWRGCFEDDLVRGWIGRIAPGTAPDRYGNEHPAAQPLFKLLARRTADPDQPAVDGDALWREEAPAADGSRQFRRSRADHGEEFVLVRGDQTAGWQVSVWQELPRANSAHADWLMAALDSDPVIRREARRKLRRHLLTPRIPADQQAEAASVLRQNPDAVEVAVLGLLPDASDGERFATAAARWVLDRGPAPSPSAMPTWSTMPAGMTATLDGRPLLTQSGADHALALIGPNGDGELVVRGEGAPRRAALVDGAATCAPFTVSRGTDGWHIAVLPRAE